MRSQHLMLSAAALLALGGFALFMLRQPAPVKASDPDDQLRLIGTLRDFRSSHADFDVSDPAVLGHHAWHVAEQLPASSEPAYLGNGWEVDLEWYDKDGNPIAPYTTEPGLPGGHFDVDVFDAPSDKEVYHKHEFDDSFDVTYIDIVNDPNLLLEDIIGSSYPNQLRVEFFNAHHGSGTYTFQAGGAPQIGVTQAGFETTFDPALLTQLRVDFASLHDMRKTSPGDVQKDPVTRDDAFAVRLFDVTTDVLVYEIATYWHFSGYDTPKSDAADGDDQCGDPLDDTAGKFGALGSGAVTSADTFNQWYRDELGVNLSQPHAITLHRNPEGVYEYTTGDFYPADDQLLGNEGDSHNNFFTYSIAATFTYTACTGLFFEFEGNDDAWVFIDGKRVIDLGGIATPHRQYVALDRLGLSNGQEYEFHFFFAHRAKALDSVFHMRTNIPLEGGGRVPVSASYD